MRNAPLQDTHKKSGLKALDCVVLDIETTGLTAAYSEIIEMVALKVENGRVKDVFRSIIKIGKRLPSEIVKLTGITNKQLAKKGEEERKVLRRFIKFANNAPLMAHNLEFCATFLNYHLKKVGLKKLNTPQICTLKLSRLLLPGLPSYRLATVARCLRITAPRVRRVSSDVRLTYRVWLRLSKLLEKQGVNDLKKLLRFELLSMKSY
jgi:DNA polymerase-3 subunit alpha (Gram-positive type)